MENMNFKRSNSIKGEILFAESERIANKISKIKGFNCKKPKLLEMIVREGIQSIVHKASGIAKIASNKVLSDSDSGEMFEHMLMTTIATYGALTLFSMTESDINTNDNSLDLMQEICVMMHVEFKDVCFALLT